MNNQKLFFAFLFYSLVISLPALAQKPELAIQKGHLGKIYKVVFSPDEQFVATSGGSNGPPTFILWDVATATFLRSLNLSTGEEGNKSRHYRLDRFSEDGRQVIGMYQDRFIALDTYTGKVVMEGEKPELQPSAMANPYRIARREGSTFVVSRKGENSGYFVSDKFQNPLTSYAFLPNYQYVISTYERLQGSAASGPDALPVIGGGELPIKLWDLAAKKEVPLPIRIDPGTVTKAMVSGDGRHILIEGTNGKTQAWKTADWKLLAEYQKPFGVSFFSSRVKEPEFLTISPRGTYAVYSRQVKTINEDFERHEVILTNLATGEHRYLPPQNSVMLLGIKTDPQKRAAAFADMSGVIYTWSLEEGKFKHLFNEGKKSDFYVNAGFNRSGTRLMASSIYYETDEQGFIPSFDQVKMALRVWDIETGSLSHFFLPDFLQLSEKGPFIYAGKEENEFLLVAEDKMYKLNLNRAEFRQGKGPVPLSLQDVEEIVLPCQEGLMHYLGVPNSNMALLFPQRRWLGYDSYFLLFDEKNGKCIKIKTEGRMGAVDLSGDGEQLLLASNETEQRIGLRPLLQNAGSLFARTADATVPEFSLKELASQGLAGPVFEAASEEAFPAIAYAQKSQKYLAGGAEGKVVLVGADNKRAVLGQHQGLVAYVSFFKNDQFAISSSTDAVHKIWDLRTNELAATIYLFSEDEGYVITTPDGRFDGNANGFEYISYIVNYQQEYENIALDQLKERYYEPNLLAKILGAGSEPLRNVAALDQVDLFPKADIRLRGQSLEVQLTSRNGGIGRVALYAGDKEIDSDINPGRNSVITVDLRKYASFFPAGKPMPVGVITWNDDDWLYSRKVSLDYTAPKPLQNLSSSTRLFALCIGTSNYSDEGFDLAFADLDAEKFALTVREAGKSLLLDDLSRVSARVLSTAKNQQEWPSKENIRKAIEEIAAKARPEDVFVLYLSGHGTTNDRDGHDYFYYLTYELNSGNINDTDIRRQYAISTKEFADWLNLIPAQKQVMVLDACASGTFNESLDDLLASRDIPASQIRALDRLRSRTGLFIISGSTAGQVSYEASPYGQGLLTYSLLRGIKSGEALRDGQFVDVLGLFNFAKETVPGLARQIGGIQEPMILTPYGSESYDIGRATAEIRKGIQLSEPKPLFCRVRFSNTETHDDDIGLERACNEQLRDFSKKGGAAKLIFVDVSDAPNAYRMVGGYTLNGEEVMISGRVRRDGEDVGSPFELSGKKEDTDALVKQIITMAYQQVLK